MLYPDVVVMINIVLIRQIKIPECIAPAILNAGWYGKLNIT